MIIDRNAIVAHPSAFSAEELVYAVRIRLVTVDELQQSGELSHEMLDVLREVAKSAGGKGILGFSLVKDTPNFEEKLLRTIEEPCRQEAMARLANEITQRLEGMRGITEEGYEYVLDICMPMALESIRYESIRFNTVEYGIPLSELSSRISGRLYESAIDIFAEYARKGSLWEESHCMIAPDVAEAACYSRSICDKSISTHSDILRKDSSCSSLERSSVGTRFSQALRALSAMRKRNYAALYAPRTVAPARKFRVQVFLHGVRQKSAVAKQAKAIDPEAELMDSNPLDLNLGMGTRVTVSLSLEKESAYAGKRTAILTWTGKPVSTQFFVKADGPLGEDLVGEVTLSVEGAPVGTLSFMTRIDETTDDMPAAVAARAFKKVFISYSHEDVKTAAAMALAYHANDIPYFFDHHSLGSGAVFNEEIMRSIEESDLFILLWSENAAHSEYVEKEYLYAMKYAYPQREKAAATLSIKPFFINPVADPPARLKGIYNFSRELLGV